MIRQLRMWQILVVALLLQIYAQADPICMSNNITGTVEVMGVPSTCNCVRLVNDGAAQPVFSVDLPIGFNYTRAFEGEEIAVIMYKTDSCAGVIAIVICGEDDVSQSTDQPTAAPSTAPPSNSSNSTATTECTRYAENNVIALTNIDPAVQCAYAVGYNVYAYIDRNLSLALFADSDLSMIPIDLFSSPDCSSESLFQTINACYQNNSAFIYNGSTDIPVGTLPPTAAPTSAAPSLAPTNAPSASPTTPAPTGPIPTWGVPNTSTAPTTLVHPKQDNQDSVFGDLSDSSTWAKIGIVCVATILVCTLFAVFIVRRHKQESKKVHTYDNGQEEVSKGEEFSVQLSDVGEQVPLSVDELKKKKVSIGSPLKRRGTTTP